MANYQLLVKIGADITDFDKKLGQVTKTMDKTAKNIMSVGANLTKYLTLPIIAFGGFAAKNAAEFEQAMANVGAVSNATAEEMKQLEKAAMTASDSFTPTQTANAMEELIKAGLSLNDVMGKDGLSGTLNLAKAESLSLEKAAILVSTALNSFKNDGLSATNAADILVGAANASATSVDQMSMSLQQVSAVASGVGMSFKDVATGLAVMAQNGIRGSDAGTSLKTMFARLQPQTKAQRQAFEDLGIITADGTNKFYDAAGKVKDLASISGILQNSLAGMTDQQRQATLQTMFGSDAIRAANVLYKEGTKGVTDMQAAMGNITAQDIATKKADTLNGSLTRLKVAYEKLSISIGNLLLPFIQAAANAMTKITNTLNGLTERQKIFITVILGAIAVIGPLIMMFAGLLKVIAGVNKVIKNWGAIGTLITSPVGLAIIAIMALVAVGWFLVSNWDEIKEKVGAAIAAIGKFFSDGWNRIKTDTITRAGEIQTAFSNWWAWVTQGWNNFWSYLYNGALYYWGLVVNFFTVSIPQWFNNLMAWFAQLPAKISDYLSELPNKFAYYFGVGLGVATRIVIEGVLNIIGFFMKLPENIGNALSSMYKSVSDWMSKTKTEINNSTTKMGSDFVAWLSKIPGQISTYFSNMYKNVSAWMDNMKWAIATALTTMFWNFVTWLGKLPSMVSNYFSSMSRNTSAWQNDLVNKASQIGRNMYNGIANWFNSLPDSVYNALSNIGKNISNFTSYLWSRAKSLGDSVWQGFKVGMGMHSPSYIEQAFMSISASATDTLKNIKTVVPKYQAALNTLKAPALDIAGANYGTVGVDYGFMNETPLEQNNFNIGSLVVREDADIYKIAQELFKLQQANLRAKGR